MADLNKEALDIWGSLKPMIDEEIASRTQGMVQRRKAKVTTAPSLVTNTIGVTEAFGQEIFLPFVTNIISAQVGDFVWVEWMYGPSNAFVSCFAEVDEKDRSVAGNQSVTGNQTVGGNQTVNGNETVNGNATFNGVLDVTPRRCSSTLSSAGWYRVLTINSDAEERPLGSPSFCVDFTITRSFSYTNNEVHKISLLAPYNNIAFCNETSRSNSNGITAIRYMHDTADTKKGYVDIYYNLNASNVVSVDFVVNTYVNNKYMFVASDFSSVGPSPANQTELAKYSFTDTTIGQSVSQYSESITSFLTNATLGTYYSFTGIVANYGIDPYKIIAVFTDWTYGHNVVTGFTIHTQGTDANLYVSFKDSTACKVHITYLK